MSNATIITNAAAIITTFATRIEDAINAHPAAATPAAEAVYDAVNAIRKDKLANASKYMEEATRKVDHIKANLQGLNNTSFRKAMPEEEEKPEAISTKGVGKLYARLPKNWNPTMVIDTMEEPQSAEEESPMQFALGNSAWNHIVGIKPDADADEATIVAFDNYISGATKANGGTNSNVLKFRHPNGEVFEGVFVAVMPNGAKSNQVFFCRKQDKKAIVALGAAAFGMEKVVDADNNMLIALNKYLISIGYSFSVGKRTKWVMTQSNTAIVSNEVYTHLIREVIDLNKITNVLVKDEKKRDHLDGCGLAFGKLAEEMGLGLTAIRTLCSKGAVYAIPDTARNLLKAFVKNLDEEAAKDYFGKKIDLDKVELILPISVMKMSKLISSSAEYVRAAKKAVGGHLWLINHGMEYKNGWMCGQTLQQYTVSNEEDLAAFRADAEKHLAMATEKPWLFGGRYAALIKADPAIMEDPVVYAEYVKTVAYDRAHKLAGHTVKYDFCGKIAPDLAVLVQASFGQKIEPSMNLGTIWAAGAKDGIATIHRNPCTGDTAVAVVNKAPSMISTAKYWSKKDIFLPVCQMINGVMEGTDIHLYIESDYDGDSACISNKPVVFKSALENMVKYVPFGKEEATASKVEFGKANAYNIANTLIACKFGSKMGIPSNLLFKLCNMEQSFDNDHTFRRINEVLIQDWIDAAKHSGNPVNKNLEKYLQETAKILLPNWKAFERTNVTTTISVMNGQVKVTVPNPKDERLFEKIDSEHGRTLPDLTNESMPATKMAKPNIGAWSLAHILYQDEGWMECEPPMMDDGDGIFCDSLDYWREIKGIVAKERKAAREAIDKSVDDGFKRRSMKSAAEKQIMRDAYAAFAAMPDYKRRLAYNIIACDVYGALYSDEVAKKIGKRYKVDVVTNQPKESRMLNTCNMVANLGYRDIFHEIFMDDMIAAAIENGFDKKLTVEEQNDLLMDCE